MVDAHEPSHPAQDRTTLGCATCPRTVPDLRRDRGRGAHGSRRRRRAPHRPRRHQPCLRHRRKGGSAPGARRCSRAHGRRRPRRPAGQQDLLPAPPGPLHASPRRHGAATARPPCRGQPAALLLQAQAPEGGSQLREGARRHRVGDDGPSTRGEGPRRRPLSHLHRVLGLPGGRPQQPARFRDRGAPGRRRRARSARARLVHGRGLADRPAAGLRGGERADARIRLLGRGIRSLRPADHLRRLRRRGSGGGPILGEGRQGGHGRNLVLRHHPALHRGNPAAAPRGHRADVRDRRHLRGTGYPGGIFNSGFARSWIVERIADARPAPKGGQPYARELVRRGDRHCRANQRLRLQTENALRIQRANPFRTPSLFGSERPDRGWRAHVCRCSWSASSTTSRPAGTSPRP